MQSQHISHDPQVFSIRRYYLLNFPLSKLSESARIYLFCHTGLSASNDTCEHNCNFSGGYDYLKLSVQYAFIGPQPFQGSVKSVRYFYDRVIRIILSSVLASCLAIFHSFHVNPFISYLQFLRSPGPTTVDFFRI